MIRRFKFILGGVLAASATLAAGCVVADDEVGEFALASKGDVKAGKHAFNKEKFGGNGTTCASCHPSDVDAGETGTLSPADVDALKKNSVLFQHDRADTIGGKTFNRFRTHATILVTLPLPPNVRIAGSDARTVTLARGIPTTMNTPALDPILMLDGRNRSLQQQAAGAIAGHAQGADFTQADLDEIALFQETLFNRENLRAFFEEGEPLSMPLGTTDSEKRGRRFFIADNQTDPSMVGESPVSKCGWCHSGNFLNEMSAFAANNIVPFPATEGHRFTPVLVSELNPIGNPRYNFEFTNPNGSVTVVNSPDPGLALITGIPAQAGFFKTPTVWGVSDTAPYFHDNSAKTLEALMEHYDRALFIQSTNNPKKPPVIDLTDQEKADIIAYMLLL